MRAFSGIQPTGIIHIGNYFGAIKQWIDLQQKFECFFCIVNQHAITIPQNPKALKKNTIDLATLYLACGLNPEISTIFIQSEIKQHTELTWILNTITKISELERMTQFKEKAKQHRKNVNVGLFDYPVLMAADILLYKTDVVPVGEDQKQHVEITRTLARRFNKIYGQTFKIPEVLIKKESARIMGLDNPFKKMSKSAKSPLNYIALDDSPELIFEKIQKAVTDSGKEIVYNPQKKPAIANLLTIFSLITGKSIKEIEKEFQGKGYSEFKQKLAYEIIEFLSPIQAKKRDLQKNEKYVFQVLEIGKEKAKIIAKETMNRVNEKIGLI
ncbi:MAG: tryptophan--tRNA ligase [Candidatus Pacebacteria bacterium]|nr:tryptophan--tRNA ligase [Candidatus Paceibacterota bacterium]